MRPQVLPFVASAVLACASLALALGAQKYTNPQFAEITKGHKQIAILPFTVNIDMKHLPKNTTVEMVHSSEREEGLEFFQDGVEGQAGAGALGRA